MKQKEYEQLIDTITGYFPQHEARAREILKKYCPIEKATKYDLEAIEGRERQLFNIREMTGTPHSVGGLEAHLNLKKEDLKMSVLLNKLPSTKVNDSPLGQNYGRWIRPHTHHY